MTIKVNGKNHIIDNEITLGSFIKKINYDEDKIIIEKNSKIIKKEYWNSTLIKENDQLEILSFVGGG